MSQQLKSPHSFNYSTLYASKKPQEGRKLLSLDLKIVWLLAFSQQLFFFPNSSLIKWKSIFDILWLLFFQSKLYYACKLQNFDISNNFRFFVIKTLQSNCFYSQQYCRFCFKKQYEHPNCILFWCCSFSLPLYVSTIWDTFPELTLSVL